MGQMKPFTSQEMTQKQKTITPDESILQLYPGKIYTAEEIKQLQQQGFDPKHFKTQGREEPSNNDSHCTQCKKHKKYHIQETIRKWESPKSTLEVKHSEVYDYREQTNLVLRLKGPIYYLLLGWSFDHRQYECECPDDTHRLRELGQEYDLNYTFNNCEVDFEKPEHRYIMTFHIMRVYNEGGLQALEDQGIKPIDFNRPGHLCNNYFKEKPEDTLLKRTPTAQKRRFKYDLNERKVLGNLGLTPIVPMTNQDRQRYSSKNWTFSNPYIKSKAIHEYNLFMSELEKARNNTNQNTKDPKTIYSNTEPDKIIEDTFSSLDLNVPIDYKTLFSRGIEPPGFEGYSFNNKRREHTKMMPTTMPTWPTPKTVDRKSRQNEKNTPYIYSQTFQFPPVKTPTNQD
jgi:hypothetical protein